MVEGTLVPMAEHNRDLERQVMCLRQKADYLRDFGSWTRAAKNSFFFGGDTTGGVTQHTKAFDVIDTPVGFSQTTVAIVEVIKELSHKVSFFLCLLPDLSTVMLPHWWFMGASRGGV